MTICMQRVRIMFSSFGEENFEGLHSICYVQIVFGYYFANNVGGAII